MSSELDEALPATAMSGGPYATAAWSVHKAGYSPIPVDSGTKDGNIPVGFTGYDGKNASPMEIQLWIEDRGDDNVAARVPTCVLGADVDAYEGKQGAETLVALASKLGDLPLSYRISSRFGDGYDGTSGIRLYRLPDEYAALATQRVWRGEWLGIEVVRFAHRFVVAPPSIHPKTGRPYRVLNETTGEITDALPNVDDLPLLPEAWCKEALKSEGERERADSSTSEFWTKGKLCPAVQAALGQALSEMEEGRHDGMRDGVLRLTRLGEQGHQGVLRAVDSLHGTFIEAASESGAGHRSTRAATAEWGRAVTGIDALIVAKGLTNEADRACCGTVTETGGASRDQGFLREVQLEVRHLEVREAARLEFSQRNAPAADPFDAGLLTELLDRPQGVSWRIEGVHPVGGALLVVAFRKAGKTTLMLNAARSYLTGERFLGEFDVEPVTGRVALLNYEVAPWQIARWADEAGVPADRLFVVNLRGRRNPLADPTEGERLRELLEQHQVEILMVDPFARAFAGVGDNSNDASQVNTFTSGLDRLAREAGCSEIVLTNHTGWNTERGRNSTALEDWPDSILTMIKDKESGDRFLSAIGRDVDMEQDRLEFDPVTRHLRLTGTGGMKVAKMASNQEALIATIVDIAARKPGIDNGDLGKELRLAGHSFQRGDDSKAAREAATRGLIVRRQVGQRKCHFSAET